MNMRQRVAGVSAAASILVLASFAVPGAGPAGAAGPTRAGTISVTCLDWYDSNKNQWHVEAHVKDGNGKGVVGAVVHFENSVDTGGGPQVYQVSSSTTYTPTFKGKGVPYAQGATCGTRKSTTVTSDQCAPSGSPAGVYTSRITNVVAPAGSGLVWDGVTPANSYTRTS